MKIINCPRLLSACLVFVFLPLKGSIHPDSLFYNSFANQQFSEWPKIIATETQALSPESCSLQEAERLFINYYGYIGHLLDLKHNDEAGRWLQKAKKAFKPYQKKYSNEASIHALNSIFIAYEIALSPLKAPFKLNSLLSAIKKAEDIDKTNYLVKISQGNVAFYFPEVLGGDKTKALNYYMQVYRYFKLNPEIARYDWVYLNTLSTICLAYEKLGQYKEAIEWAKRALNVAPDFVIVKDLIMPRLIDYND